MDIQSLLGIKIQIEDLPAHGDLGAEWSLLDRTGTHSFFQSWAWVGPWLLASPKHLDIAVVRALRGDTTVGLALMTRRKKRLAGFIHIRQGWLNASGDSQYDRLAVEHNGFATTDTERGAVARAFIKAFSDGALKIDELILPWMDCEWPGMGGLLATKKEALGFRRELSSSPVNYSSSESRNSRQQLNRAMRKCEAYGSLELRRAQGLEEKLSFFSEMKQLHRASWRRRNRRDAFDNPHFEAFCSQMIQANASDEIDLLKVCAGPRLLGVLLNLRRLGTVYNYQSGFDDSEPMLRPGYVTHAEAIKYYSRAGEACYDFLLQPNQLKQSFGTEQYSLYWQKLQRPTALFKLELLGRRLLKSFGSPFGDPA